MKKLLLISIGVTAALAGAAFVALAVLIWATDNPRPQEDQPFRAH